MKPRSLYCFRILRFIRSLVKPMINTETRNIRILLFILDAELNDFVIEQNKNHS